MALAVPTIHTAHPPAHLGPMRPVLRAATAAPRAVHQEALRPEIHVLAEEEADEDACTFSIHCRSQFLDVMPVWTK